MSKDSPVARPAKDRANQLAHANQPLRRAEQTHVIELDTLQQLATQSITAQRIEPLYDQILDTILTLLHADLASLQSFYPKRGSTGELKLLAQRGFSADTAKRWEWVTPATRTICGEALRTGRRVAIEDIRKSDSMAGSEDLEACLAAGVRSAQSFPLRSRAGDLLGMVSVYWREIHDMSGGESRAWEILARLAADVMERSVADENLRSALQELQLITDNMAAAVSRCSRDLRYLWVSPSYATWLGKSRPEAIAGRYIPDVLGGEGFEGIRPHVEKVLAGEREEFETQVTYLGRGRRWIHAVYVPTRAQDNSVDGWISVIRDVTEQHEAEERLRHSEERFRRVADSAPVIIWVCGPDKLCTFVNKGWLNFTGRSMGDELGYGWTERIHPEDFEASVAAFTSSYDTRRRYQIEYRAQRADSAEVGHRFR
jgi:PAS domain S-box-containing protein